MFQRILKCDYEFMSPWWDEVSVNAKVSNIFLIINFIYVYIYIYIYIYIYVKSLLVLQNFSTARKSGNIS